MTLTFEFIFADVDEARGLYGIRRKIIDHFGPAAVGGTVRSGVSHDELWLGTWFDDGGEFYALESEGLWDACVL